ncbi:uncharacterized protein UTRI_04165 [Ustilago trichophora]|uniref:Wbp11/ELF5/Saf1 N-terminal domain-containing protein n=1 Tax=Ustilago trichophora TaxID=86804 RepID=A0A5C3EAK5_9BASI|nr:uncharacterized protein UTRI_04165 [Ustilago trichophora]
MAKTADPVQAARKAAIKRQAKRNRERKEQAQEARTLRQDTTALERHIQRLEARQSTLDPDDLEELKRLQAELAKIKSIKEEYIRKHPDQRNFVRGYEDGAASSSATKDRADPSSSSSNQAPAQLRSAASGGQRPESQRASRDPRWSIYYDSVFNPYGAPPPGMPYLEKPHSQLVAEGLLDVAKPPPLPEETEEFQSGSQDDSDDSSVDEDLKDIIMPAGPPPIRLLPDHQKGSASVSSIAQRGRDNAGSHRGRGQGSSRGARGRGAGSPHYSGGRGPQIHGGSARPIHSPASLPPRPPAGFPARPSPAFATANPTPSSHPSTQASGPPRPPGPPPSIPDGVVISAEPQLRDLKKESTAFIPAAIRKKQQEEKARMKRGLPGKIDAAPISEDMSSPSSASYKDRPDLLKSLQAHLPAKGVGGTPEQCGDNAGSNSSKKEYDQFLNEIGDLL